MVRNGISSRTFHLCLGLWRLLLLNHALHPHHPPISVGNGKSESGLNIPTMQLRRNYWKNRYFPPHPSKLAGLSYRGQTGTDVEARTIPALTNLLDARYGKKDSERSLHWLDKFTEFAQLPSGNLMDFRARFLRTATRRGALGAKMSEEMMSRKGLHSIKLSEAKLPTALPALETKPTAKPLRR